MVGVSYLWRHVTYEVSWYIVLVAAWSCCRRVLFLWCTKILKSFVSGNCLCR